MSKKSKQRKQAKNEARKQDPTYTFKRSEMREYLKNLLRTDPEVQKVLQEEAHEKELEERKKQSLDLDTLILMALRRVEKYGHKRMLNFAKELEEIHKYYHDFYKDCDMYAMRRHLKDEVGIDVELLNEEVAKLAEENSNKRKS